MTTITRNIFTQQRKSFIDAMLPYVGGIFITWCVVWLVVMSFDGVGK